MSFSIEVKEEITKIKEYDAKAELLAFLRLNTSIIFNSGMSLELQSSNFSVAKRFLADFKQEHKDANVSILTKETNILNKGNVCIVRISQAKSFIDEYKLLSLDNYEVLDNQDAQASYLRGAFLINGSINNPEVSHHLEIRCKENKDAIFIQKIMNNFDLNSKIGKRRAELIVYLKDSEKIQDFLYIIGATRSYFKYSEVLINKKVKGDVMKSMNCELFNASKSYEAGQNQLRDIAIIEKHTVELDDKIKELIAYRKEYIDASLTELVAIYEKDGKKTTKSSLNHRFRKIHEIAEKLSE